MEHVPSPQTGAGKCWNEWPNAVVATSVEWITIVARAFAGYDWPEIRAGVLIDNPASARVLDKLGFVEAGAGEGPCAARGATLPLRRFRLARP